MKSRLRTVLPLLAALAAGGAALAAGAWAPMRSVGPELREEVFVIPPGTWARRTAGEKLEVLPSEIRLTVGVRDILVLRNHDDVPQMFGPVLIMPGQSFQMPFRQASRYQFACTAHVNGQLTVIVEAEPKPGLERLRWRWGQWVGGGTWL